MSDWPHNPDPNRQYAVVTYVPEPLGPYLDRVRMRLAPWMPPGRSHVTVLSPRPLRTGPRLVWEQLRPTFKGMPAVEIELREIEVFRETNVVYMGIGRGAALLKRMHLALNSNGAQYQELFSFHPHITLAQGLPPEGIQTAVSEARRAWSAYDGPTTFLAKDFHFVENDGADIWTDLETVVLK